MNKLFAISTYARLLECRTITTRITPVGKDVPKKKSIENRITLIGTDDSVSITDLKSAQSLSIRRELKLVKIQDVDTKTRRPVYKLLTNAQYHEEELARRKEKQACREKEVIKGQKLLTLSSRIAENDLMTGVKKILKLLDKNYEVRVVVIGEEGEKTQNLDRIHAVIEKNTKESGKVVQKRDKGNSLKFQLIPLKEKVQGNKDGINEEKKHSDKGPL